MTFAPLPAPTLTPRARAVLLGLSLVYAAVMIPAAIHRSTDLQSHLMLANRMLDGLRVYEPKPQFGTWWPPGALALLAPLAFVARLSLAAAKGLFTAFGVLCVAWIVARTPTSRWMVAGLALAAVCGPLQKDFENLNLNVAVLTLILATARDLAVGRDARAGVWLGIATAAKVFPALLIPLLPRGPAFTRETLTDWSSLTSSGTAALRGHTQSLAALVERTGAPPVVGLVVSALLLASAAYWLRRRRPLIPEIAMVTHVALLATPLVWAQNFVLLYLTWVVLLDTPPPLPAAIRRVLLPPLVIATSGIITAWSRPVRVAMYRAAVYTWGALGALVLLARVPPLGEPPRAPVD
jgi:hypothetical protein